MAWKYTWYYQIVAGCWSLAGAKWPAGQEFQGPDGGLRLPGSAWLCEFIHKSLREIGWSRGGVCTWAYKRAHAKEETWKAQKSQQQRKQRLNTSQRPHRLFSRDRLWVTSMITTLASSLHKDYLDVLHSVFFFCLWFLSCGNKSSSRLIPEEQTDISPMLNSFWNSQCIYCCNL